VAEVKLIYNGTELAAAILDDPSEINAVVMALADFLPRSGGDLQSTAGKLLGELTAPAPT
jgi:hypothetical protein